MTIPDNATSSMLDAILRSHHHRSENLLQVLIDCQQQLGWIDPASKVYLANALALPLSRVDAVIAFYSFLYDRPVGKYRVLFSDNIIDQMLGGRVLYQRLLDRLGLRHDETSANHLVSVGLTACTGMGDQGPALLVNGITLTHMDPERIDAMAELIEKETPLTHWPSDWITVDDSIRRKGRLLSDATPSGSALKAAMAMGVSAWLHELEISRLRGRGGAGFATAIKTMTCQGTSQDQRVVVCNADEGEPGTFKDRLLLSRYAERVFEGMAINAFAVKANQGFLYLRGEYRYLKDSLDATLQSMRQRGLLGQSILGSPGFDFDIDIHMGAGAYICGEETALIESLEGKPGKPRIRPPFPVTHGYLGRPTVVNNVETLANLPLIAVHGGRWFASEGTAHSSGSKILSVSGDCARPGIYEYPFGVTLAEILSDCGAVNTMAVQVGGASGRCLADYEFNRRIAFEDIPSAGAFMVFDRRRDMFETARNFAAFFAHESCGFCTPCRVGTTLNRNILDKIARGAGSSYEINELKRITRVMQHASHCGLGQTAGQILLDSLDKFRPAFEHRLNSTDFVPAFDLDQALAKSRHFTGRNDRDAHLSNRSEG